MRKEKAIFDEKTLWHIEINTGDIEPYNTFILANNRPTETEVKELLKQELNLTDCDSLLAEFLDSYYIYEVYYTELDNLDNDIDNKYSNLNSKDDIFDRTKEID